MYSLMRAGTCDDRTLQATSSLWKRKSCCKLETLCMLFPINEGEGCKQGVHGLPVA